MPPSRPSRAQHDYAQVFAGLEAAEVPAGAHPTAGSPTYAQDPQYLARAQDVRAAVQLPDGRPLKIPAVVLKLQRDARKYRADRSAAGGRTTTRSRDLLDLVARCDGAVRAACVI